MTVFSELIIDIATDLNRGGFVKEAIDLQQLAKSALDETMLAGSRKAALKQIEMRCHVKWLGDFYLPDLSQKNWWGKLEKLSRITKKYAQSI